MRSSHLWFWTLAVAFVSTASAAQQTMTTVRVLLPESLP